MFSLFVRINNEYMIFALLIIGRTTVVHDVKGGVKFSSNDSLRNWMLDRGVKEVLLIHCPTAGKEEK